MPASGPLTSASGGALVPGVAPYPPATAAETRAEFGYGDIRPRRGGSWLMRQRTVDGTVTVSCEVAAERLDCVSAP